MWPDKPIGSGGFIAEQYDFFFDHISLNYWAEGYINFGILGGCSFFCYSRIYACKTRIYVYEE